MADFVPLFVALIWPITILILLIVFRNPIKSIVKILESRLQQGDKLSAFGVSIEPADPKLGLPSVSSPVAGKSISEIVLATTGTDKHKELLLAIGETSHSSGYEPSGLVGIGDALAMATVHSMFLGYAEISLQTSVIRARYARINQLFEFNPNIITIGGPFGNSLTRAAMSTNLIALGFDGLTIVDRRGKQRYEAMLDESYLTGTDWGMLLCLPNPFHKEGRVIVVAGIYGYGTYGATTLLSEINKHSLLADIAVKGFFEALVEIPVQEGVIGAPNLVLARAVEV